MLTKEALRVNLIARHVLLYRLALSGVIAPNTLYMKWVLRFPHRILSPSAEDYSYLQKWEKRLSRIEDNV